MKTPSARAGLLVFAALLRAPIHRWSINPFTPGITRNPDGSMDILIQRDRPAALSNP